MNYIKIEIGPNSTFLNLFNNRLYINLTSDIPKLINEYLDNNAIQLINKTIFIIFNCRHYIAFTRSNTKLMPWNNFMNIVQSICFKLNLASRIVELQNYKIAIEYNYGPTGSIIYRYVFDNDKFLEYIRFISKKPKEYILEKHENVTRLLQYKINKHCDLILYNNIFIFNLVNLLPENIRDNIDDHYISYFYFVNLDTKLTDLLIINFDIRSFNHPNNHYLGYEINISNGIIKNIFENIIKPKLVKKILFIINVHFPLMHPDINRNNFNRAINVNCLADAPLLHLGKNNNCDSYKFILTDNLNYGENRNLGNNNLNKIIKLSLDYKKLDYNCLSESVDSGKGINEYIINLTENVHGLFSDIPDNSYLTDLTKFNFVDKLCSYHSMFNNYNDGNNYIIYKFYRKYNLKNISYKNKIFIIKIIYTLFNNFIPIELIQIMIKYYNYFN